MPIPLNPEQIRMLEEKRAFASRLNPLPVILIVGAWLWLEFAEKPAAEVRQAIKNAGFLFSGKHRKWFFNGQTQKDKPSRLSWEQVQERHGATIVSAIEEETATNPA